MTIFTVRIEAANAYPQLLPNGNLVEAGDVDGDRHYAIWHDPHPKPSYLFAAVIGDLNARATGFRLNPDVMLICIFMLRKATLD